MTKIYRAIDGEILDAIVWQEYKNEDGNLNPGLVEWVLGFNPHLTHTTHLQAGDLVTLPKRPKASHVQTIKLWD